ncbi:MAG: hypothetical protein O7G87_06930 [bacterium]|nr:hypothetical protein [bacterium]
MPPADHSNGCDHRGFLCQRYISVRADHAHLSLAMLIPFTFLLALNLLLERRSNPLSSSELLTICSMGMVAACMQGEWLSGYFLGVITSPTYFATAENRWAEILLQSLPNWGIVDRQATVLFSLWFFNLLTVLQIGIFNRLGFNIGSPDPWTSSDPAVGWQNFGGHLGLPRLADQNGAFKTGRAGALPPNRTPFSGSACRIYDGHCLSRRCR